MLHACLTRQTHTADVGGTQTASKTPVHTRKDVHQDANSFVEPGARLPYCLQGGGRLQPAVAPMRVLPAHGSFQITTSSVAHLFFPEHVHTNNIHDHDQVACTCTPPSHSSGSNPAIMHVCGHT